MRARLTFSYSKPPTRRAARPAFFLLAGAASLAALLPGRPGDAAPAPSQAPMKPGAPAAAKASPPPAAAKPTSAGELWTPFQSDFPFQVSCVSAPYPAKNTSNKSVSLRLAPGVAMNFDTDLLRMATGWTGAYLTPTGVAFDTSHGGHPQVAGDVRFGTKTSAGWADAKGSFDDPRKAEPFGPIPEKHGRWDGLYTVGKDVVLAYTVLGSKVYEQPSAVSRDGRTVFVRTFKIAEAKQPLGLLVADVEGAADAPAPGSANDATRMSVAANGAITEVVVSGAPAGAKLERLAGGRVVLRLPKGRLPGLFKVSIWNGHPSDRAAYQPLLAGAPTMVDFAKGGPRHFPQPIVTKGEVGSGPGPYVVDRLTTPFPGAYYRGTIADWKDNVYKRRIMIAGLDFFSDGKRAALSTWEGDVWIVEGIDDKLERLTWRRFASGGYETLGLKIVDDVIYTSGRDQITRYHDLNGDGEADYYENFNNQVTSTPGFHEFQFDLHTDKKGNFYTSKAAPVRAGGRGFGGGGGNGEITRFSGTIQKISKDGRTREIYASGFRAPNGIGVGPDGQVTAGDNEGTWMPACPIHWVKPGGFHGVEDVAGKKPAPEFTQPLMWISKAYDNSGGSQLWVENDKWGPFKGELLHLSYGRAAVYLVMKQKVGEQMQGGIVRLVGGSDAAQITGTAQKLTSSAMRARFNPRDGQLYVVGLAGWQTDAVAVTGFDRVRYTGKPVHTVRDLKVTSAGIALTFSHPLDPQSVSPQNFSGERWNYRRTSAYGSPEFSVADPETRGHDPLDVLAATLSEDGRTVTLQVDDLRPAHQVLLKWKLKAQDGTKIAQSLMHTIHVVPRDPKAKAGEAVAKRAKPGLHLTVTGASGKDVTLVPNVNLFVAAGRAPSPLVAPGRFQAVWEGTLSPELAGEHAFRAELAGALKVEVDGKVVYEAATNGGPAPVGKPVALKNGENRLRVTFTGPDKGDAFVRLEWKADKASPFEPIPATALRQTPAPERALADTVRLGRELFLEHRCAKCHLGKPPAGATPELAMDAPSFDGIGARRNARWMAQWIANPRSGRSDARMPVLVHGPTAQKDAVAMATYLATLGAPAAGAKKPAAPPSGAAAQGEKLWNELNCMGCHSPLLQQMSDDGKLQLMHVGRKFAPGALAEFLLAPEAHFKWTRMPNFRLTRQEAEALAAHLLASADPWTGPSVPDPDATSLSRGKTLVQSAGCLSCHAAKLDNKFAPVELASRLGKGAPRSEKSCVDGAAPAARFAFNGPEKEALKAFLADANVGLASLGRHAPAEFASRQVKGLQCNGCHGQLEGFPAIDGLGGKLRPEWTSAFIAGQVPYKPRPEKHADGHDWLAARMPAFPARAALLAEGLAAANGVPPRTPAEPPIDRAAAKQGEILVSANGGFACVTCHAVGPAAATQVFESEGVNLAYSSERLLPSFFRRWLRNPMKVDPTTKMPVYFDEEGKSPVTTIYDGDGDKQIEALWHYLRSVGHGRGARPGATASR